jgi:N-acetylglutamate synthase/N-acetylornithine aminotransferase
MLIIEKLESTKMTTYKQHQVSVAKAQASADFAYRVMTDYAIANGSGMVTPRELRKLPDYAAMFADIDATEAALQAAKNRAVEDLCAHRCGNWGDRFEWYSEKDARKWRRQRSAA